MKVHWVRSAACSLAVAFNSAWAAEPPAPLLKFAAVADVQYADKDPSGTRYYRNSLDKLAKCAEEIAHQQPAFIINLGDFTDGQKTAAKRKVDVEAVAAAMKRITVPWHYVLGNHDDWAGRQLLTDALSFKEFYYEFTEPAAAGWRFVVLDGNDAGYGVMSTKQLDWFRNTLEQAKTRSERVICFCHYPLIAEASQRKHAMHQAGPILDVVDKSGGVVVAWINGHDHSGGYAFRNGVHHLTVQGMCETKDQTAFAIIRLFSDHISVTGFGRVPSRELPIAPPAPATTPDMVHALRPAA